MVESARVDSRKDLEQWDEYPDVTRIPIVVAYYDALEIFNCVCWIFMMDLYFKMGQLLK